MSFEVPVEETFRHDSAVGCNRPEGGHRRHHSPRVGCSDLGPDEMFTPMAPST